MLNIRGLIICLSTHQRQRGRYGSVGWWMLPITEHLCPSHMAGRSLILVHLIEEPQEHSHALTFVQIDRKPLTTHSRESGSRDLSQQHKSLSAQDTWDTIPNNNNILILLPSKVTRCSPALPMPTWLCGKPCWCRLSSNFATARTSASKPGGAAAAAARSHGGPESRAGQCAGGQALPPPPPPAGRSSPRALHHSSTSPVAAPPYWFTTTSTPQAPATLVTHNSFQDLILHLVQRTILNNDFM